MSGAVVGVLVLLIAVGVLYARSREGDASSGVASAEAVVSCVQAAGYSAALERSSTGTPQVTITHGPGAIGQNTTLQSSSTSIAYLPSADEAAFFVQQLTAGGQAVGIAPELVSQRGNAVVVIGLTATAAERATIDRCLV